MSSNLWKCAKNCEERKLTDAFIDEHSSVITSGIYHFPKYRLADVLGVSSASIRNWLIIASECADVPARYLIEHRRRCVQFANLYDIGLRRVLMCRLQELLTRIRVDRESWADAWASDFEM